MFLSSLHFGSKAQWRSTNQEDSSGQEMKAAGFYPEEDSVWTPEPEQNLRLISAMLRLCFYKDQIIQSDPHIKHIKEQNYNNFYLTTKLLKHRLV